MIVMTMEKGIINHSKNKEKAIYLISSSLIIVAFSYLIRSNIIRFSIIKSCMIPFISFYIISSTNVSLAIHVQVYHIA